MSAGTFSQGKIYLAVKKSEDQVIDPRNLKMQLEIWREKDLEEYFREILNPHSSLNTVRLP